MRNILISWQTFERSGRLIGAAEFGNGGETGMVTKEKENPRSRTIQVHTGLALKSERVSVKNAEREFYVRENNVHNYTQAAH